MLRYGMEGKVWYGMEGPSVLTPQQTAFGLKLTINKQSETFLNILQQKRYTFVEPWTQHLTTQMKSSARCGVTTLATLLYTLLPTSYSWQPPYSRHQLNSTSQA